MQATPDSQEAVDRARDPASVTVKRLLVPLDGSELAQRALPFARYLAHELRADLLLVRAAAARRGPDPTSALIKSAAEAQAYFDRFAAEDLLDLTVEYSVPFGEPVEEIAALAELRSVDLIVMTTHGRSGLRRLLLGSVADGLVRRSSLPLLLIRGSLPLSGWEHGIQRVLVPLDGSELAETTLSRAVVFAGGLGAGLILTRVVERVSVQPNPYDVATLAEEDGALAREAARYLAREAGRLRQHGLRVDTRVLVGDPARCIGEVASEQGADLIAMATHARAGLHRLVLGSVADEVLRSADVPLLLFRVPPRGPADSR